jgi:hypothetical protein
VRFGWVREIEQPGIFVGVLAPWKRGIE